MTAVDLKGQGYATGTWSIDPVHSEVGFAVRHAMVAKVRGRFTKFEGTIVTGEDPLASSASVTIDPSSIDTGNEQRANHIRSADFLEVEKHPEMTYRSAGVRQDGEDYILDGELTIRGVTRPVPLKVEVNGFGPDPTGVGKARAGFTASGEIDRTEFGVNFNGPIPGGVMVSEKVQLQLEVEAVLQKDE